MHCCAVGTAVLFYSSRLCKALPGCSRKVLSVRQDLRYWPTWQLRLDPTTATWERQLVTDISRL